MAPYFVEEVRKHLEQRYGAKALYESGLSVKTTLDATLQEAANRAVERGLRQLDKRRGYRRPKRNVLAEGHTIDNFKMTLDATDGRGRRRSRGGGGARQAWRPARNCGSGAATPI